MLNKVKILLLILAFTTMFFGGKCGGKNEPDLDRQPPVDRHEGGRGVGVPAGVPPRLQGRHGLPHREPRQAGPQLLQRGILLRRALSAVLIGKWVSR